MFHLVVICLLWSVHLCVEENGILEMEPIDTFEEDIHDYNRVRPNYYNGILLDPLEYDDYGDYSLETIKNYAQAWVLDYNETTLVPDGWFPYSKQDRIDALNQHNLFKSNDTPPFPSMSDQEMYEWDDDMERFAYLWSAECVWLEHGRPKESGDREYTQNLYFGPSPLLSRSIYLWYMEYLDYNLTTFTCMLPNQTKSITCGHFTTLMWSKSHKVGCDGYKCNPREPYMLVTCHYEPMGNFNRMRPFEYGPPCSRCERREEKWCSNKLCVDKAQCAKYNFTCECPLQCEHCSAVDKERCMCDCVPGWYGHTCEKYCNDSTPMCNNIAAEYLKIAYCPMYNKTCPRTCDECRTINETNPPPVCCDDVRPVCPENTVRMDDDNCTCRERVLQEVPGNEVDETQVDVQDQDVDNDIGRSRIDKKRADYYDRIDREDTIFINSMDECDGDGGVVHRSQWWTLLLVVLGTFLL